MRPEECREAIRHDGFVVVERLCGPDLIARILETAKQKSEATRDALGDQEIGIGSAAGYDEIVQRSPGRWDVPISPDEFGVVDEDMPWHEFVTAVLGEDADSPHVSAEHRDAHALNVLIALQDISLEMGPTEVATGSQRLTNHLANPSLVADELIYQEIETPPETLSASTLRPDTVSDAMPAGTCLIFDDRLLHRGLANQSDQVRHVAYFSYRQRGYSENTHFESTRSVYEG